MADTGKRSVKSVCEDLIQHDELLKACSIFVQQVCGEFGYSDLFSKGDNADAMIGKFSSAPFVSLNTDGDKATKFANDGYLVLGGLTLAAMLKTLPKDAKHKPTMGHVVVVAPGGPCRQMEFELADGTVQPAAAGYPYCYGGAAISIYRLKEMTTISLVMPKYARDQTLYAYLEIKSK